MLKRLFLLSLLLLIPFQSFYAVTAANSKAQEILQGAKYPVDFRWGTAVAEWQNSGSDNLGRSNWSDFEEKILKNGKPTIKDGQKSGKSCDCWNNMERNIAYMQQIKLNSYRFSVSWEAIEPKQGEYNQAAIDHYHTLIDSLIVAGIDPMITIIHFVHPGWFEDLGGFEKQENIAIFTKFAEKVFTEFSSKVKLWCIINESNVLGFQSYINGEFPPGQKGNVFLAATVVRNLMQAHAETYLKLKALPNGDKAQIGFVHQYLTFEPYTWFNPVELVVTKFLTACFANAPVLAFLKTGKFNPIPYTSSWNYEAPTKGPLADFIGLNFYSRILFNLCKLDTDCYPDEIMTDMPYALCPDKFYNAIQEVSKVGLPIYVTENGIADKFDNRREIYFKGYLGALSKAIKDGFDIRGFYYWTLIDNFEWNHGRHLKFGLVEFNDKTKETRLRDSVQLYTDVILASAA